MLSVSSSSRNCGWKPRVVHGGLDHLDEVRPPKLVRGDVDANAHRRHPLLIPALSLGAGLVQDQLPDLVDQACLLGYGDELLGADQADLRAHPSGQRFQADKAAGGGIHLRLVVDRELMGRQALPDLSLEGEAFHGAPVHFR